MSSAMRLAAADQPTILRPLPTPPPLLVKVDDGSGVPGLRSGAMLCTHTARAAVASCRPKSVSGTQWRRCAVACASASCPDTAPLPAAAG